MKKLNIKKLLKYIALSIVILYFVSGMYRAYEMHNTTRTLSNIDIQETEKFLSEYQDSVYSNNKLFFIEELKGCLEMIKYMDEHPNLKEFADYRPPEDGEMTDLAMNYSYLYQDVTTLAYEEGLTIKELQERFERGEQNVVMEHFKSTNYSKETFSDIIGLIEIGYNHHGIGFDDMIIYKMREVLKNENRTIEEELELIKSEDLNEISKFLDEHTMLNIKYPYALEMVTIVTAEASQEIVTLVHSIVIGSFIGIVVYAYSEAKKILHMVAIAVAEMALIVIVEELLLKDIGGVYNGITNVQASSSLPISATAIVGIATIGFLAVKVVLNKLQVKKLNDLNETTQQSIIK